MKNTIFGGIGIAVVIIIIGVIVGTQTNYEIEEEIPEEILEKITSEQISTQNSSLPEGMPASIEDLEAMLEDQIKFDFEAHDLVRFYDGEDEQGATIVDILNARMYQNYPEIETITNNPHRVEWYNYPDDERENIVIVGYAFETFKEDSEYVWEVNKISNTLVAQNEAAQELLDIVNSEN